MQVASTPRSLVDPGPPPTPEKTLTRWEQFLGSIAVGVHLQDAMLKHYMTRADIETCVRHSAENRAAWNDARVAALKRGWTTFDFEDIFERIAGGMGVMEALAEVKGAINSSVFNQIVTQDMGLNEQYLAALKAKSLVMQEQIVEMADTKDDDTIENHTKWGTTTLPNNAAVNRSKLQVETRLRLMAAWNTKMFGESKQSTQVNVQVNYAEKLESARTRSTQRAAPLPALTREFIDAAFADVSKGDTDVATDTSWLDATDPATDTTWLET